MIRSGYFLSIIFLVSLSCQPQNQRLDRPNIILIMADDMGYECLGSYGSTSYSTPVLDNLAANGIQFDQCISQPLCTPSRVKIMTGRHNYRNYDYFGHLNETAYTFGNLMKEAGYSTCIAGKWQLNGLAYKDQIPHWSDNSRPDKFGFDEYCLWQLTKMGNEGGRFSNPLIEQNGKILECDENDYGPDIFSNYIIDFIERKKEDPFFIYYPMVLVHDPFVPTPDSKDWSDVSLRTKNDTTYFKDMVAYTDRIVGNILEQLKALEIADNTILIFTGDNGTHYSIYSKLKDRIVQGGKGNTTEAGIHVPLIISWPEKIKNGQNYPGLVDFSDFFPTFADLINKQVESDGESFLPLLKGEQHEPKKSTFIHYDPKWGKRVNQFSNQFVMTTDYKLYRDGSFYHIEADLLEERKLNVDSLEEEVKEIHTTLLKKFNGKPILTQKQ